MNETQRACLETLRERYSKRGMDVHDYDGGDNLIHVVVYGRITGAEVEVHTIAVDGQMDAAAPAD